MSIDVQIECGKCLASVFRAVGRIVAEVPGAGCLNAVMASDSIGAPGGVGVMTSWDICPDRMQVALFRRIWDEETGLDGCVIAHESPTATVDKPRSYIASMN